MTPRQAACVAALGVTHAGWCCVFIYVPLALVLLNSFNTDRTFAWPPPGYTTEWWQAAWHSQGARDALWASVQVATRRDR